jgi:hypothetical protein
MNNSFARLIDGMNATLRQEVLTRLDDEFARGQVYGVINLLNTFKVRADWSAGFLREQVGKHFDTLDRFAALVQDRAPAVRLPDLPARPALASAAVAELLKLRDEVNGAICALLGWLEAQQAGLGAPLAAELETQLRESMRAEIAIELKNSPLPLFAEMSSGRES